MSNRPMSKADVQRDTTVSLKECIHALVKGSYCMAVR